VKKKVLIIVENLPVPFDTRVWKQALALHKAGYDVTVLSPKGKGFERSCELRDGIHIYRHPVPKERNGVIGYVWEFSSALLLEILYSWWIYMRQGFCIIQGCNPPDNIFLVALPFKLLGVKYIFDHHDLSPELYWSKYERQDILYKIQLWLENLTFRISDVVMSTNNTYRDIAVKRGSLAGEDVFVVRNGPDLNSFHAVSPNPTLRSGRRFLVGYVGTISVQEGLDILLDVADYIKKIGRRDVNFICVGGGPGLAGLKKSVQEKNLGDMVRFTGRVSDAELVEILSTADVCVNPDRPCPMNDMSTMIKVMEYMALGKPIVQFDLKEGRYSAQEASLYCDSENRVRDFAEKILWLLDHPDERQRMGEFGRMRVEKELAWEYSVGSLLAAYERAFAKMSKGRVLEAKAAAVKESQ
jgi:glycosyltransferase involved in cell wall biosynthesis